MRDALRMVETSSSFARVAGVEKPPGRSCGAQHNQHYRETSFNFKFLIEPWLFILAHSESKLSQLEPKFQGFFTNTKLC